MRWKMALLAAVTVAGTTAPACDCGGGTEGEGEGEEGEGEGEGEGEEGEGDVDPDDVDGDGRSNDDEVAGYDILIDASGFGLNDADLLTSRTVTSDPNVADTDGDGLDDGEEFLRRTDPRDDDTDGDGLSDAAEVVRWGTSPVSVDSDGDARGDAANPSAPDSDFFDGAELNLDADENPGARATSPSLADTDGDGVVDSVEEPNPTRSAVVADLPSLDIELVDNVDMRLRVSYVDDVNTTEEFSTEVGTATTNELSRSDAESLALSASLAVSVGAEVTASLPPSATVSVEATATVGVESTRSTEVSQSTAEEVSQTNTEVESVSSGRSVATESGAISVGVRATNDGDIAYRLENLAIAVRQFDPEQNRVRSLAIMTPTLSENSFVLPPSEDTGVIPFAADDLEVDLVRSFLRNPSSLIFEPVGFDLQNADGTSFVFLTEDTFARTALVVVDRGQGEPAVLRVATNVDKDETGALKGVRIGRVLEDAGFDFAVTADAGGIDRLSGIGSDETTVHTGAAPDLGDPAYPAGLEPGDRVARRFWVLFLGSDGAAANLDVDFPDLRLKNGDEARLLFGRDEDRDGIFDREEYVRGSSDASIHSDGDLLRPTGDGLSDYFEIRVGWEVTVVEDDGFALDPYVVYPNPALVDSDDDGLDDREEFEAGTDPHLKDTDFDGLQDNVDPAPTTFTNTAPVNNLTAVASFGRITLQGSVTDTEGNLERVEIDWGDGSDVEIVSANFGAIDIGHDFDTSGDVNITVRSRDRFGLTDTDVITAAVVAFPTDAIVELKLDGTLTNTGSRGGTASGFPNALTFVRNRDDVQTRALDLQNGGESGLGGLVTTSNLALGNSFTVSTWVRLTQSFNGNDAEIAGQRDWYGIITDGTRVRFGRRDNLAAAAIDTVNTPQGTWVNYVGSYARSGTTATLKLYRDGVLVGTTTVTEASATPTSCLFAVGSPTRNCTDTASDDTTNNFPGEIDDVRVFNRVLSDAEVAAVAAE